MDFQTSRKVDPEREQAVLRLSIISLFSSYLYISGPSEFLESPTTRLAVLFLVFSACNLASTFLWPGTSQFRRIVGLVADISAACYGMYLSGERGAPLYVVLLWTVFGNGIRYGKTCLILATMYAATGFAIVVLTTPFWTAHPPLSYGLLIGLVALPAFIATLLGRLKTAIDRAEEASRAKNRFIANMSHEMRTPLHGIIGTLDLMQGTDAPAEREEFSNTIRESARTLLALVSDVLDVSRIEEGGMKIAREDIDFHALLKSIAVMVSPLARAKGLYFRTICSPAIPYRLRADRIHLEQVLLNLLGNAVKFTEKGEVRLKADKVRETSTHVTVRLEISDTGIGISTDAQARIFQRFAQADESITRRYGGTGLGTNIAKQLVELMGGEMGIRSEPGKGTEFWFALDLEKQPAEESPPVEDVDFHFDRLLIVSRDEGLSAILKGHLASWNIRPTILDKAVLAFSPLFSAENEGRPFLAAIVVEKGLDMDPLELAKALRSIRVLKNMKLILVSGGGKEADLNVSVRQGFDAAIDASVDRGQLFNTLRFVRTIEGRSPASAAPSAAEPAPGEAHRPLRILVAEDNATNQLVIRKMLERMGHSVRLVENGAEALDGFRTREFDVGFLDLNMPVMGGLEAARVFRSEETSGCRLPIIAITADATAETRTACSEAGMDGCVIKPFDGKKLSEAIGSIAATLKGKEAPPPGSAAPGDPLPVPSKEAESVLRTETLDELEALGGKGDFVKNLVWMFLRDAETKVRKMEAALSAGDVAEFCTLAHAMKGNAGQIGAVGIMDICEKLQHMKGEPSAAGRRELFEEFREEVAAVKRALTRRICKTA